LSWPRRWERSHPELTFEQVVDLVDYDTIWIVGDALILAWTEAFPKREAKENPPQPVPS